MLRYVRNSWKEGRISLSSILEVLPYTSQFTDAISLVIPAYMNDWKMYFAKATHRMKRRRTIETCVSTFYTQKKPFLTLHTYTVWSIMRCIYWADITIWRLRATSIWKLESMLVHRVTWRSPWEIIADTNCRCLWKSLYEQQKYNIQEYLQNAAKRIHE